MFIKKSQGYSSFVTWEDKEKNVLILLKKDEWIDTFSIEIHNKSRGEYIANNFDKFSDIVFFLKQEFNIIITEEDFISKISLADDVLQLLSAMPLGYEKLPNSVRNKLSYDRYLAILSEVNKRER